MRSVQFHPVTGLRPSLAPRRAILARWVAGLGVLVWLAGCSPADRQSGTRPESPAAPGTRTDEVAFLSNSEEALRLARDQKKLVMLDLYTDWCTWCKKLDEDVYPKPEVVEAVRQSFVPLKLNPETTEQGASLMKKFGVDGFPTILILDGEGNLVHRIVGYREAPEFVKELEAAKAHGAPASGA